MYFIYNFGSMMISVILFLFLSLCACSLCACRDHKFPAWLLRKITSNLYWNSSLKFLAGGYTVITMCVCINTLNVSKSLITLIVHSWFSWRDNLSCFHSSFRPNNNNLSYRDVHIPLRQFQKPRITKHQK